MANYPKEVVEEVERIERARDVAWFDRPAPIYNSEGNRKFFSKSKKVIHGPVVGPFTLRKWLTLRHLRNPFVCSYASPETDIAFVEQFLIVAAGIDPFDSRSVSAWVRKWTGKINRKLAIEGIFDYLAHAFHMSASASNDAKDDPNDQHAKAPWRRLRGGYLIERYCCIFAGEPFRFSIDKTLDYPLSRLIRLARELSRISAQNESEYSDETAPKSIYLEGLNSAKNTDK